MNKREMQKLMFSDQVTQHTNKTSHHIPVTNVCMQCCHNGIAQHLHCLQVCLTFVNVRIYLVQN